MASELSPYQRVQRPTSVVALPPEQPPILLVVIDTEEEFDWSAAFDRGQTGVSHMREIERLQRVFDESGVKPVYVVDYPIASQEEGAAPLRAIAASGRAEIGAHLHPWVSPPHDEEVTPRNSYPGNLPLELERAKLERLTQTIERGIGVRPRSYKAGRYGFGPNTAQLLEELGYEADLSACPGFDFASDGGPDYSSSTNEPSWFGERRRLLAVPNTGGYVGFLNQHPGLYRFATRPGLAWTRLPGILSRLRAIERLRLSPEGFLPEDHRRFTRSLLARGVRVFSFSLHSPSVKPGCTAYVRSESERDQFLDRCRRYFDFFLREMRGVSMTALELKRHLEALPGKPRS
jgi:hypothetical protein